MKKLIVALFLTLSLSTHAMQGANMARLLVRNTPGKAFSAIAHTSFACGMLNSSIQKLAVTQTDQELIPHENFSFSYLETMIDGGNEAQLLATSKRNREELLSLATIELDSFDFSKEGIDSFEKKEHQGFYAIILKNEKNAQQKVCDIALALGNKFQDTAKEILAAYEDKDGVMITAASKYPFIVLTAKSKGHLQELKANLENKSYTHVIVDDGIGFFHEDTTDKNLTKKFSLAR